MLADIRDPLPLKPVCPARQKDEYERGGMWNVFLAGKRYPIVTAQQTKQDRAQLPKRSFW